MTLKNSFVGIATWTDPKRKREINFRANEYWGMWHSGMNALLSPVAFITRIHLLMQLTRRID